MKLKILTCTNLAVAAEVVVDEEALKPVLQLVVGQPATLEPGGLGAKAGRVKLEVNGLELPVKVTHWEDAWLAMEAPAAE